MSAIVAPEKRQYSKQDTSRVIKAQSYQGAYYPRSWLPVVFNANWSIDDICWLISADCSLLAKLSADTELDDILRLACREEQLARRQYRLPASGLPYIDAKQESRNGNAIIFGDEAVDKQKRSSNKIGFYDLLRNNSSNKIDIFKHLSRVGRDEAIRQQSERIAGRLEGLGIPAYRKSQDGTFYKVGLLSGLVKRLDDQYRHIMFIPAVAVSERRALTNELNYWIDNILPNGGKYLRYMVITCGENIRVYDDLKEEHRKWTRKVSDVFRVLNEKYESKLYFRGTEFTFNEGMETINMHMNILFDVPFLPDGGWTDFLNECRERLGCIIKDAGRLKDVNELTKYVTKPNDIEMLEDDYLLWFYEQTLNTRLIQRYNSFKSFKSGLNEERLRIVRDHSDGSLKTMRKRVINDSELFTKNDEHKANGEATTVPKSLQIAFGADLATAFCIEPALAGGVVRDAPIVDSGIENKIVGLMLPHHAFFNFSEPCLIVQNYNDAPASDLGEKALDLIETISKRHHADVVEKVKKLGSRAVTERKMSVIRSAYGLGLRDVDSIDGVAEAYMLDTYTISHMTRNDGNTSSVLNRGYRHHPDATQAPCGVVSSVFDPCDPKFFTGLCGSYTSRLRYVS